MDLSTKKNRLSHPFSHYLVISWLRPLIDDNIAPSSDELNMCDACLFDLQVLEGLVIEITIIEVGPWNDVLSEQKLDPHLAR
jgi:hypothetical protein